LIHPQSGSIRFAERDIAALSGDELNTVRTRMGMVFQSAALISSIDVGENLALPLTELTDKRPEEIDRIVDEKLALVGMKDAKAKLPSELSGGMRKRVGIARALVLEPELVLFDEPAAGLDPVATALIDELIVRLRGHDTTCLVVTHNLESAFRIATRLAMLHDGAILEEGPPDAFRATKNPIVRQFLDGDPEGPLSDGYEAARE
jgi:phospholipid/cholesterol/gamma-HCH transport system ATP-binding protein